MARWIAGGLAGLGIGAYIADNTINDSWEEETRSLRKLLRGIDGNVKADMTKPHVVILGTGWAAASFVRKLDLDYFRVTLVSPRNYFLMTPMLAGSTVGTVEPRSIVEPIRSLLDRSGAKDANYLQAECVSVNPENNFITCKDSSRVHGNVETFDLKYDQLVVAVGAQSATFGIKGVEDHALFMKEIKDSKRIRDRLADCLETASLPGQSEETLKRLLHFVVVGGGPSGVEFAAELHDFLKNDVSRLYPSVNVEDIKISLFDLLPHVLNMFDKRLVDYTEKTLMREGIRLRTSTSVTEVKADTMVIRNPDKSVEEIPYGAMVWVAGIATRPFVTSLIKSLNQNSRRGLLVGPYLNAQGATNIWGLGDCALAGNPPTAQVAVQEGKYLGGLFNEMIQEYPDTLLNKSSIPTSKILERYPTFSFANRGAFAYIGDGEALAQIPTGDVTGAEIRTKGQSIFLAWRIVYVQYIDNGIPIYGFHFINFTHFPFLVSVSLS